MKKLNYLIQKIGVGVFTMSVILLAFTSCRKSHNEVEKKKETCEDCGFISVWKVDNNAKITIPVDNEYQYDYSIYWNKKDDPETKGDKLNITSNSDYVLSLPSSGEYVIKIVGNFPAISFYNRGDASAKSLLEIKQWGDIRWQSMRYAFNDCSNLNITASDSPNLSEVASMEGMFMRASSFNSSINHWDVSRVTNMKNLFRGATKFNQPLDKWNVSHVVDMEAMFKVAKKFNQNINDWDVSNVTNMKEMFNAANDFNKPLGKWNVSNVTNMREMFLGATFFNQDLNNWRINKNVTPENSGTMFNPAFDRNNIKSWGW